ncbi:hypothetical protein BKA70DRAFT_1292829 [Coprinopsis sp. MPI-PUGE-AT-0042]|nr:hypothetical protein BKA70DRAFT_1292829 [Coprinopsis sp. MPI-PUGE-AT-0042]
MPSVLPPEIDFEILGHLSPDAVADAQTLRSASLVCSHFRSFCQRALFRHLVVKRGSGGETTPSGRLLEAFKASPILATYVQSLAIKRRGSGLRTDLQLFDLLDFLLDASAPITEFSCLLSQPTTWQRWPERIRRSIIALSTLPRLTHLSLVGVPLEALHFGGLQHLKDVRVVSAPDRDPGSLRGMREDRRGPPAQIHELVIAPWKATLEYIVEATSGLDLCALAVLTLIDPQGWFWEMGNVAPLLNLCRNSLVEMHLKREVLREEFLVLTELTKLQIITISTAVDSEDGRELQYTSGLFLRLGAMLQTLPSQNSLRVVQLGERDDPEDSLEPGESSAAMQQLDSILSQPKFRSLERLVLLVLAPHTASEEVLVELFPNLQEQGALSLVGAQEKDSSTIMSSASDRVNHIYH